MARNSRQHKILSIPASLPFLQQQNLLPFFRPGGDGKQLSTWFWHSWAASRSRNAHYTNATFYAASSTATSIGVDG
ncbi:unnamed protein product [Peronospora belbahrii]|uniref:Uncharacterized protein n=1 Tax=Peronospora belbahrii TaxID=622444 RepID=A0AAU9LH73_9STRA|nr:unnamed protein product [Peronospora belbahrii]CAH0518204.1 unnamed protein product [Peronospora belbahrii]